MIEQKKCHNKKNPIKKWYSCPFVEGAECVHKTVNQKTVSVKEHGVTINQKQNVEYLVFKAPKGPQWTFEKSVCKDYVLLYNKEGKEGFYGTAIKKADYDKYYAQGWGKVEVKKTKKDKEAPAKPK